nr:hypothetical protein [Kibdelosporangium sp. MJ126-NF4]CTQ94625.1 hypothetical protein [Kibdelosporangium sp. MJ126-NF4]
MSTTPAHRVHLSGTPRCTFRHTETHFRHHTGNFMVLERWTRRAGKVDTAF